MNPYARLFTAPVIGMEDVLRTGLANAQRHFQAIHLIEPKISRIDAIYTPDVGASIECPILSIAAIGQNDALAAAFWRMEQDCRHFARDFHETGYAGEEIATSVVLVPGTMAFFIQCRDEFADPYDFAQNCINENSCVSPILDADSGHRRFEAVRAFLAYFPDHAAAYEVALVADSTGEA
jgi:hypothetical protein